MASRSQRSALLFAAASLWSFEAAAQEVLAPPPIDYSGAAAMPRSAISTGQLGPLTPAMAAAAAIAGEPPLWSWGPINLRGHLLYRLLYGDGFPSAPGQNYKTVINEVDPGVLFELGPHWTLDYTPSLRFYSNQHFQDTTDHAVRLNGATTYEDWSLGLSQGYATSSQPLYETGAPTEYESYSTTANAAYQINTKTSLELGLSQSFQFVGQNQPGQALTDSRVWSTMDWLNYQFWPRFGAGVGASFGYINMGFGPDMTFEQAQGRINWQATDKVSLMLSGGLDDRQFLNSTTPALLNPIFMASALYKPFESTTLSLNAGRMVSPSLLQGLVAESTTVSGGINQRFFRKLNLSLTTGYTVVSYELSFAGSNLSREDDLTFANVRLSAPFRKRGTVAIFYQASENSSTQARYKLFEHPGRLRAGVPVSGSTPPLTQPAGHPSLHRMGRVGVRGRRVGPVGLAGRVGRHAPGSNS